jgi:hypothetical protein
MRNIRKQMKEAEMAYSASACMAAKPGANNGANSWQHRWRWRQPAGALAAWLMAFFSFSESWRRLMAANGASIEAGARQPWRRAWRWRWPAKAVLAALSIGWRLASALAAWRSNMQNAKISAWRKLWRKPVINGSAERNGG